MARDNAKDLASSPAARHSVREALEGLVTVLILVLLLRAFVADFFVIPTGSMATTLLGNNHRGQCPQCGHAFPVDASSELEQDGRPLAKVTGCICPNCGYYVRAEEFKHFTGQAPRAGPAAPPRFFSGNKLLP